MPPLPVQYCARFPPEIFLDEEPALFCSATNPKGYAASLPHNNNVRRISCVCHNMKIIGSIVEEQGVTFAIVLVKQWVTQTPAEADKEREALQVYFPNMPIVLASQDFQGRFSYQGRKDIVDLLANISPIQIPWKDYQTID